MSVSRPEIRDFQPARAAASIASATAASSDPAIT
jgi:hypothetical protein